ncbi:MFS transporter [Ornatilinea apprima]|uniref:MFS transporter n=1 Tax=Ornatilinea apprima TaxID=1134406 RepID=A0A0N8GNY2_9CHLR|nr:MFS transporter [Ornatilinea apprima]KPL79370.1 MFS transporter [Ornatilinea apprima]
MASTTLTKTRSKLGLILLAYIAFISLGLPDGLLGVAWPSMRKDFGMPLDALGLMLIASMIGYLTSSFFSGKVMARLGVGRLLAVSCMLTGAGLIGYTLAPAYWLIVALGVVGGLGAGAIDAGINTYIASEHGEGLMQWLHASFGIGVTLGPIIMTAGINLFQTWRTGYLVVGSAQIALAACFAVTAGMWKREDGSAKQEEDKRLLDYKTSMRETVRQVGVWVSVLLFFVYVGVELTLGHWSYSLLTESRGIAPETAGLLAGGYWGMFTVGRVLAGLYAQKAGTDLLLRGSMLSALAGALLLLWNPSDTVSLIGIAVVGFSIAPIFPALVSSTGRRVSARHAANTIGMQISASGLGGALLPALAGALARRISLEVIPVFLVSLIVLLLVLYFASLWMGKRQAALD